MKRTLVLAALLFLAAADPWQPLIGHWTGASTCTGVRAACHDEKASYWIKAGKSSDMVSIDFAKVVDGKDDLMGTTDFRVDFAARTLTGVTEAGGNRLLWRFTWSGPEMTGTLKSSDGQVIRNIRLTKER